jgi:hypothetical protein
MHECIHYFSMTIFHSSGMVPALLREGTFDGVVEPALLPDDRSGGNGGLQSIKWQDKNSGCHII